MTENIDLLILLDEPTKRRCWLLDKALERFPLDRALDLARRADTFLSGSVPAEDDHENDARIEADENGRCTLGNPEGEGAQARTSLELSREKRDLLLQCLAAEARNKDLAFDFGLTLRQIQGFRMGCAIEIARRRTRLVQHQPKDSQIELIPAQIDDVVRYLRQQDDVVVPQRDNDFLVNGRHRLGLLELVARANRIRARERKPQFECQT